MIDRLFEMRATPTRKILGSDDPDPYTLIEKPGRIIFSGPHNGIAVPSCMHPHMGMDKDWFFGAHEARDLHVDRLFEALDRDIADASLLSGNYSRLVCDLNCAPDYAVGSTSSEHRDLPIEQNQPQHCCSSQRMHRVKEIYWPYHDAKTVLIEKKRRAHNGGVIVLDLHSFSPTWQGIKREEEIGTIRCEKTPLSRALEAYLRQRDDFKFTSGFPYRVADRPSNAAPTIVSKNDLQYLGLEIRHDLIATDAGIARVVDLIKGALDHIAEDPNFDKIVAPRKKAVPDGQDFNVYADSWVI